MNERFSTGAVLREMDEETYRDYMEEHSRDFARDRARVDGLSDEVSLAQVQRQVAEMLPKGKATPNHFFYSIRAADGREVGYLWAALFPDKHELYLYHVFIHPHERRKGFGRAAMALLDDLAREKGCRAIWLNVFYWNDSAKRLYEACGYSVGTIHMTKRLS